MMARDISYSFFFFFFSLIFFNLFGASISIEKCTTTSACNSSAPFSVSFPFRFPDYQSNIRCGYNSSFSLWCSTYYYKQTLLYIPNSGFFSVDNINYSGQKVNVTDPDGCFPRRFLSLDLSTSPFSFSSTQYSIHNHTYYNCSRSIISRHTSYEATCMSDTKYSIIVLTSEGDSLPDVKDNCTVIKSFVLAPYTLFLRPYESNIPVELYWSEPQCGVCASRGQTCGFKDGSNYLVECQNDTGGGRPSPSPSKGPSPGPSPRLSPPPTATSGVSPKAKSGKSKTIVAVAIVVPIVTFIILVAACKIRSNNNRTSEQQQPSAPPTTQLTQTRAPPTEEAKSNPLRISTTSHSAAPSTEEANLNPIRISITSHSAPSIKEANLNPICLPGEGDVLLEPIVGPCVTPQIFEDLCHNDNQYLKI